MSDLQTSGADTPAATAIAVSLRAEERRRQFTVAALTVGLFVSTVPVTNERALFSPLGDIPILGELSPVAYAVTFGSPPGGGVPGGPGGRAGGTPPVAFAARIPPEGFPAGQPIAPPAVNATPLPPLAAQPGAAGGATPAGAPGGGGGLPGTGASPGALPPPESTTPPDGGPGPGPGVPGGDGGTPNPTPAVPEPATWMMMLTGFGVVGALMRRARRVGRKQARTDAALS